MKRLEVSGAVRHLQGSLGVKGLIATGHHYYPYFHTVIGLNRLLETTTITTTTIL
jgi:hypothetical protein